MNTTKTLRLADFRADIWTRDLPNTKKAWQDFPNPCAETSQPEGSYNSHFFVLPVS
jgi:hypothetical protein